MKRASYRDAIDWIANNDSDGEDEHAEESVSMLVTACLVADIFGVARERVGRDVVRLRKKQGKERGN